MFKWIPKLIGGRPMRRLRYLFTDEVDNQDVNAYIDKNGRYWMANNRWGWFRVEINEGQFDG